MLTFLATTEARTRQSAAVRAACVAKSKAGAESRSWRGSESVMRSSVMGSVSGFDVVGFASDFAARATRMFNSYRNIITCRHTNKFSSALVVPAPRVSTVLNT